jgi:hypothetical protein
MSVEHRLQNQYEKVAPRDWLTHYRERVNIEEHICTCSKIACDQPAWLSIKVLSRYINKIKGG